jgi:ankyrin repeat protein
MEEHMNFEAPCTVHSIWLEDTPLHTACVWGDIEAVRLLVEGGADVNARGDLDTTPPYDAVTFGHVRCATLLLSAGATDHDPNELSCTARRLALRSDNARMRALFGDHT